MNSSSEYRDFSPSDLASRVLAVPATNGITISGGEPFEQNIGAMGEFLSAVRAVGKSVICFSGFRYEDILADAEKKTLLASIDLLIDGEYREQENNGSPLRGSDNQRFIFLTDCFLKEKDLILNDGRKIECDIGPDNSLEITGIPERGFLAKIERELNSRGLEILW